MSTRGKNRRTFAGVTLPPPYPINQPALAWSTIALNTISFGIDAEPAPPEPKGQPKTVIGVTGYRLYTLDQDLYLIGQQGNKQEGRESPQGKHEGDNWVVPVPKNHVCPGWDCLCGYSALFWPTSLEPSWSHVLAEVQADGRTIVGENGFRAERIILNKLWVACSIMPESALSLLRERYEVPVEVL